jgi:hypothetical protein
MYSLTVLSLAAVSAVLVIALAQASGRGAPSRLAAAASVIFAAGLCAAAAFALPLSPAHDSFTLVNSLKYLINGRGYTDFARTYFNFWGNNKVSLLVYYAACRLTPIADTSLKIITGVRSLHFLSSFGASLFTALSCRKLSGGKGFAAAVLISALFYPYLALAAPYVYPLALFLSALSFYLSLDARLLPLALPTFGLLMLMRPTAGLFIPVYHALRVLRERKSRLRNIAVTAALIAAVPLFKYAFGAAMLSGGFHPWPKFDSASAPWQMYVGTNLDGEDTGICLYKVDAEPAPDADELEIAFHRLWELSDAPLEEYKGEFAHIKSRISTLLAARARDTILDAPGHLAEYLSRKTYNLLFDDAFTTYFTLNVADSSFRRSAELNLEDDSSLALNAFLALSACALVYCAIRIFTKKRSPEVVAALTFFAGALCSIAVFVLLTEVGKRYLLDLYPALTLAIIVSAQSLPKKIPPKPAMAFACAAVALSALIYQTNNLPFFRGADVSADFTGGAVTLTWEFEREPPPGAFIQSGATIVPLQRRTIITAPADTTLTLSHNNRTHRIATHHPLWHERLIAE